ncbi:MAG: DegV family protein [Lachnospiraceae bacterium]|nr:DegV family protein [Lachnospiraceae bacterium]
MSIKIVTDTACDISLEDAKKLSLKLLPLKITFGDEEFLDGFTMSHDEFFEKLIETDVFPKTSQVSPSDYEEAFKEALSDPDVTDVLCITVSSKLSGCFQSANIAASEFDGKVHVVDSITVCIGQRLLIELACGLRDEGMNIDQIEAILNKKKNDIKVIALLDTLEYLKKGGRISSAVAFAGNLLSIKPVIAIENGEVVLLGKARGSKAGNNKLNEYVENAGGIDFSFPVCLAFSGLDDALLSKYVEDSKPIYAAYHEPLRRYKIGCAIGSHAGPGAIATAFFKL